MRRRLLVAAAAVVLALAAAAGGYYLYLQHASRDIRGSSTVEFVTTQGTPPASPGAGIAWPTYGFDGARRRAAAGIDLAPPFRPVWTFRARTLVEFPPVVGYGRLFFASNAGILFAVGAENGKRAWSYSSGRCVAASPALDRHLVFIAFMNEQPCNRSPSPSLTGEVAAFAAGSGRIVWRRTIGPSESSPLVLGQSVYVGDWNGRIWALDRRTGAVRWQARLQGQVKGAVAGSGRHLYVGDYAGHVYELDAATGRVLWQASAQPRLGSTGTFYATPAIAYGRVYIGSTDGKMYSFGATSGKLRWSSSTGGYVYSSAAVWHDRVLVGSYSSRFYCFDAATGATLWQFDANGPISGSPTVIAGRVYFATLAGTTYALDAASGRLVWTYPDGKYTPVAADTHRLYLVGYTRVYALAERTAP